MHYWRLLWKHEAYCVRSLDAIERVEKLAKRSIALLGNWQNGRSHFWETGKTVDLTFGKLAKRSIALWENGKIICLSAGLLGRSNRSVCPPIRRDLNPRRASESR